MWSVESDYLVMQIHVRQVSCVAHQEMYKTQIDELMARKGE